MDTTPMALLKAIVPRLPLMIKTAILNILSLSPAANFQDVRVEVITTMIRSLLEVRSPLLKAQLNSLRDPGIKGRIWVSKCVVPAPESDDAKRAIPEVREALVRAITELGDGSETYDLPDVKDIEVEWTGVRSGVDKNAPRPEIPENEHYENMMKDENRTSDVTVLYLHGGAYVVMDPASHRLAVAGICKETHGRGLSVRYRLAPQNPFPAALLDAFIAYLYLLYPPPGSFHQPTKASSIIVSGDSAGGGLSTALLLMLLTLRRAGVDKVRFHGKDVDLPLPGGFVLTSPWVDVSRSMPSVYRNAKFDYIEPPSKAASIPPLPMEHPTDSIWPTNPPRVDTYCNANMIIHPLVTPIAAMAPLWEGHPPVWISTGSEGLQDEDLILAERLAATGKTVVEVFEGMPHVFAFIFPKTEWSHEWFKSSGSFCSDVVRGNAPDSSFRWWTKKQGPQPFNLKEKVKQFIGDEDEIDNRLLAGREWRMKFEKELIMNFEETGSRDSSNSAMKPKL